MTSKSQGRVDPAAIDYFDTSGIVRQVIAEVVPAVNSEPLQPDEQQAANLLYEARRKFLRRKAAIERGEDPELADPGPFVCSFDEEEFDVAAGRFRPTAALGYKSADHGMLDELRRLRAENDSLRRKLGEVQSELQHIVDSIRL